MMVMGRLNVPSLVFCPPATFRKAVKCCIQDSAKNDGWPYLGVTVIHHFSLDDALQTHKQLATLRVLRNIP